MVLPEFPPHFGGMQTHAVYLSQYLANKGYRIEVLTYRATDPEDRSEAEAYDSQCGFPIHRTLSRLGFWYNIEMISTKAYSFRPNVLYASNVYYGMVRHNLNIPIICRSVGNDLLRPWIAYPFLYGSSIVSYSLFESKIYSIFKKLRHPEWVDSIFHHRRLMIVRESISNMSHIFANSQFTANILANMGAEAESIRILIGGVDSNRFTKPNIDNIRLRSELSLPSDGFLIMTACRLVPKKGLDFLLQAIRTIKSFIPNAYLVIVGDGKERRKCEDIAVALGIADCTIFTGYVPHHRIHKYYWSCDLFVLASRTCYNHRVGTRDVETMGRVLCEANAAGVPVIASRSGGIPSVVTHGFNGLLFEEGHRQDFLRQVWRLWMDKSLGQALVENGRRRAREQFDWSIILKEHEKTLRGVAEGNALETDHRSEAAAVESVLRFAGNAYLQSQ